MKPFAYITLIGKVIGNVSSCPCTQLVSPSHQWRAVGFSSGGATKGAVELQRPQSKIKIA